MATRGRPAGAKDRFRAAIPRLRFLHMVWAEDEPQQFQSSSSIKLRPRIRAASIMERLLSVAVVAREQPGK